MVCKNFNKQSNKNEIIIILTSFMISPRGFPEACKIESGINGSVNAALPLSEEDALVFGDVAEGLTN